MEQCAYTFTIRATDAAGNSSDLDVRIEMEDAVAPVITGVMTGGDPDTLQTSFTVAEGLWWRQLQTLDDGHIICSLEFEQQRQRQFYNHQNQSFIL